MEMKWLDQYLRASDGHHATVTIRNQKERLQTMARDEKERLRFDGRVAIVTGAALGIGRKHADLLAARGAAVVVNDLGGPVDGGPGSSNMAEQAAEEIRRAGGRAVASAHSVATEEGAQAIVDTAIEHFGRLDIVVNNAGISNKAPTTAMPLEQFNRHLAVHVGGSFLVTRAAWPHFSQQSYGKVIFTGSMTGLMGSLPDGVHYCAAKGAVLGMARQMAFEGRDLGIAVNVLLPGAGGTRMTSGSGSGHHAWMEENLPPAAVSPVVAWLAHESCDVTGGIFLSTGGWVARIFVGLTQGYTGRKDLTPEDVRRHFGDVVNAAGVSEVTWDNEMSLVAQALSARCHERSDRQADHVRVRLLR